MNNTFPVKMITATLAAVALALVGCKSEAYHGRHAMAELSPTMGNNVHGTVEFWETPKGLKVEGKFTGLTPGQHGFHIHESGDCSAPDATSAGGHFNPMGMKHGGPNDAERHAGDFGNITADASGNATFKTVDAHISFDGANSVIGKGVIVHAKPDDLTTQKPPGNAGARVACGPIKMM